MQVEVDHVFILTSRGAPAADELVKFGLTEGSPNVHPGQGTACRRFFFENAMLELIWIAEVTEAQSAASRPTRLWERWSDLGRGASPFGIILRPRSGAAKDYPFEGWDYRPETMPGLELRIAAPTSLVEPMWCFMEKARRVPQPREHSAGFRELTRVRVVSPEFHVKSVTAAMVRAGVIALDSGDAHLMEVEFDRGAQGGAKDLRPALPLILRW